MPKMLELIGSCRKCPHRKYEREGHYRCTMVQADIPNPDKVALFCPLPDFPSGVIADLNETVAALREPYKYHLAYALMSHIATKLGRPLTVHASVILLLKDGRELQLRHDHIREISIFSGEIHFFHNGKEFKLLPDATPPELYEQIVQGEGANRLWGRCELA